MSARQALMFTVILRKVSTGAKVTALACDNLDHAYSIATVLINSPHYNRCYAVGLDWQQNQVFEVRFQPQEPAPFQAPAPMVYPAYVQQAHALPVHDAYAPAPRQHQNLDIVERTVRMLSGGHRK